MSTAIVPLVCKACPKKTCDCIFHKDLDRFNTSILCEYVKKMEEQGKNLELEIFLKEILKEEGLEPI